MSKYLFILLLFIFTFLGCSNNQKNDHYLNEDAHSYANFNDVRITHMNLSLTVDFQEKTLDGKVDVSVDNYTNAKQLILDSKDLTIKPPQLKQNPPKRSSIYPGIL